MTKEEWLAKGVEEGWWHHRDVVEQNNERNNQRAVALALDELERLREHVGWMERRERVQMNRMVIRYEQLCEHLSGDRPGDWRKSEQ